MLFFYKYLIKNVSVESKYNQLFVSFTKIFKKLSQIDNEA